MGRYANTTTVTSIKTRSEIDQLLLDFGCDAVRWTINRAKGLVVIEFTWDHKGESYAARFSVQLPTDDDLRRKAVHATNGNFLQSKFEKLQKESGRTEMRVLLLWLKAAFNAVEVGIVDAVTVFLPFLVDVNGNTIGEVALPRLPMLLSGGAEQLIGLPTRAS